MKLLLTFNLLFFVSLTISSQNLVMNGGFENFVSIPNSFTPASTNISTYLKNWLAPTNGTPDYFHKLSTGKNGLPLNNIIRPDSFYPHGESACIGIGVAQPKINSQPFINEYIQTKLISPLLKNHKYKVTFFYRIIPNGNLIFKNLGVYFSHDSIRNYQNEFSFDTNYSNLVNINPQIANNSFLRDTCKWIQHTTIYKSDNIYNWITLGHFGMRGSCELVGDVPNSQSWYSYFNIDDVSIIELSGIIAPDSTCYNELTTLQSGVPGPFAWYKNNVLFSTDSIVYVTDTTNNWYHLYTPFGNDSLYLIIKDKPTLEVVPKITMCQGDTINLKAVSNANDLVWLFNSSPTNTAVRLAGTYVAIASKNGCLTKDTTIVSLVSKPQLTINDEQFCSASLEKVNITLPIRYKYYWPTFNDSLYQRNIDRAAKYTIIIIDSNACKTRTSFNVIDMCSPLVFVPNAFVPNGVNSTFKPTFSYVKSVKWEIYNRWGNLVFSSTEQDQVWDGTFEGNAADTGTYIYNIIYTDSNNTQYQIKGNLILIR